MNKLAAHHRYRYFRLYLMVLPGIVFFIMFYLIPIGGIVIAWKDFNLFKGLLNSPWVGWKHFERMMNYPAFMQIVSNTMSIGLLKLVIGFPFPLIIALLLNEVGKTGIKRLFQTIVFLPNFLSWVVVAQIFWSILSPNGGIVNNIIRAMGGPREGIFFMIKENWIQPIIVISDTWKVSGYTSVIYLAALTAIDPQLYEAAEIDGAGRMYKIFRISLPLIAPTIIIMLLLQAGRFLETGFEHVWNMMNAVNQSKADILNTYIYRVGLLGSPQKYSFTTAVGLFKSLIGFILLMGGNWVAQRTTGQGFFSVEVKMKKRRKSGE